MKKGCFLTSTILFTIIVGVLFFIFNNYGDEVLNNAKEAVINFSSDDIMESVGEIENNKYKDSLKVIVEKYVNQMKEKDFSEAVNETGDFFERIKFLVHDGVVDSADIVLLRKYVREDEEQEKN